MKACPACGSQSLAHCEGGYTCIRCGFDLGIMKPHRRHDRRYKRVLRRLDKIGARLAGIK